MFIKGFINKVIYKCAKILNEEDDVGTICKAINTLGLIKTKNAKKNIEKFIDHEDPHIRKNAAKSLKRLEK